MRPLASRFATKFIADPNSGCWLWIGGMNERGYGIIGLGTREQGVAKAHRVSWQIHRGEIPEGQCVLHACDTPACVRPDHLFLGTLSANMQDCVAKKRNFVPNNRLENNTWHKLTCEQVREIKAAKAGKRKGTGVALARKFGVSKSAIYEIWRGKNWAALS